MTCPHTLQFQARLPGWGGGEGAGLCRLLTSRLLGHDGCVQGRRFPGSSSPENVGR